MNTTANLKKHPKTGVYRYRRTIPPRLVGLVGQVEGFEFKRDRRYFERSLGVRDKVPANRMAAEIDKLVSEALARAERALAAGRTSREAGETGLPAANELPARVDIPAALKALEKWRDARTAAAEDRYINLGEKPAKSEADFLLATFGPGKAVWDGKEAISAIPDFDSRLVSALASQDIEVCVGHPALRLLRSEFHRQWRKAVDHEEHLRHDRIIFEATEFVLEAPPQAAATAQPSNAIGSPELRTHFLVRLEEWSESLTLRPRQKSMYVSDVTAFAAHIVDQAVETLTIDHVQSWVDAEAERGISGKTITRKLAAIRSYWAYLTKARLVAKDHKPFSDLELPRTPRNQTKRKDFSRRQIVDFWKTAKGNDDGPLADLIRLAAYTGARIESLCTTTADTILIDDDTGIRYFHFNDKTDAGDRYVPIHPAILDTVDRLLHETTDGYLIRSTAKNRHGERSPPLSKRFSAIKQAAGFGREHVFHSIRKTVCTLFQNMECPEAIAADIVGHEVGTMTYGVYGAGSSLQTKKKWLDRLDYLSAEFAKG